MPRFSLFKGVKGKLVGDPKAKLGQRRYACQRRIAFADGDKLPAEFHDHFEPVEAVLEEHRMLDKAVDAKELERVKGPVVADSHAEAAALLVPAPKKVAPKKVGGND